MPDVIQDPTRNQKGAQMAPQWKSPLEGYENAEPLPDRINPDGKSLYNPPAPRSAAYDEFPAPIKSSNNGFDFHSQC